MELNLTVVRYRNLSSQQELTARIGAAGGTIGRNPDNDLSLPDPDRWVGRRHAKIDFRDGAFFLVDTSKNGTVVNQAAEPLHEGQEVELHDGDELGIGAYEIRVSIQDVQPRSAGSFDPFAAGEPEPLADTLAGAAAPDILDMVAGAAGAGEGPEPSPPAGGKPKAAVELDDWLAPSPTEGEPLAHGAERAPSEPSTAPTEPDHTPDENAYFRPPDAIPENYDIWADESRPRPEAPEQAVSEPESPGASPAPGGGPAPPEAESVRPLAGFPETTSEAPPSPEAAGGPNAPAAFLAGLGVGELPADPQARAQLMRAAGLLLRAMIEGLMRVLMGRASFKSELRLEMTTIQSTKNNPFKFSVDPEDALAHLLFRPSRGFLPPLEAAREAFDDIQCHEMAMMAGLRAALRALLARMDPAELEKKFRQRSVIDSLMPMARKAKYWDLFTKAYDEISADAAEDFLDLFRDAFTAAYEDQASRLRQAGRGDRPAPGPR